MAGAIRQREALSKPRRGLLSERLRRSLHAHPVTYEQLTKLCLEETLYGYK